MEERRRERTRKSSRRLWQSFKLGSARGRSGARSGLGLTGVGPSLEKIGAAFSTDGQAAGGRSMLTDALAPAGWGWGMHVDELRSSRSTVRWGRAGGGELR